MQISNKDHETSKPAQQAWEMRLTLEIECESAIDVHSKVTGMESEVFLA